MLSQWGVQEINIMGKQVSDFQRVLVPVSGAPGDAHLPAEGESLEAAGQAERRLVFRRFDKRVEA